MRGKVAGSCYWPLLVHSLILAVAVAVAAAAAAAAAVEVGIT